MGSDGRGRRVGDAVPAVKAVESGGGAACGFPSVAARPLDPIMVLSVGSSAQVNLVIRAASPTSFYSAR